MEPLWRRRGGAVEALRGTVEGLWKDCGGAVEALWRRCGGSVEGLWRDCGGAVENLWRDCGGSVEGLWRDCGGSVEGLWKDCGGTVEGLWRRNVCGGPFFDPLLSAQPYRRCSIDSPANDVSCQIVVRMPIALATNPIGILIR